MTPIRRRWSCMGHTCVSHPNERGRAIFVLFVGLRVRIDGWVESISIFRALVLLDSDDEFCTLRLKKYWTELVRVNYVVW